MPRNSVPPDGLDDSVIPELAPIAGSTDGRLEKHLASPPFVSTTDNDITAGSRVQTRNSHIARDEKKNPQRLASIESCCAVDSGTLAKLSFTSATGARSRLLRLRETRFNWPSDPQLSNSGGKSTTIRCVTGQTPFEQGVITLGGVSLTEDPKRFKQIIGYVGESTDIYDHVRARVLYQFVRQFYHRWDDQRFWQLMTDFDLNVNQKIKQYSKGMRVRLHLAIALSHHADVLIMDEPTTGLDPLVRNQLLEILSDEAHRNGASLLFSTHITEDVQKIATDVCFMADGSLILKEEVSSIQDKYLELQ
ncbi:MAG: ABC transporter ATP-binding protein, partial [Candidatus Methanomethylophilaceae archaeon]|nr:ABC transporter ATP-binding protein [Candidatus Methanomethylophilaceae archaeon]